MSIFAKLFSKQNPVMKHIFVVNPCAGKSDATAEVRNAVAALGTSVESEIYVTHCAGDATRFVLSRCAEGDDAVLRFYACGGDGTLNEVVSGAVGFARAEVACFPSGSGNDYVKYYGGSGPFLDIRALTEGDVKEVDVMQVGDRYALNVCNFGFDAVVCRTMEQVRRKPIIGGRNAYTTGIVKALFTGRRTVCRIAVDGRVVNDGPMLFCTMGNGRYVGGAYQCSPLSQNDDGLIEVCVFKPLSIISFACLLGSYRDGSFIHRADVQDKMTYLQGKEVEISCDTPVDLCLDGELVRDTHFLVRQLPRAVRFVVPRVASR